MVGFCQCDALFLQSYRQVFLYIYKLGNKIDREQSEKVSDFFTKIIVFQSKEQKSNTKPQQPQQIKIKRWSIFKKLPLPFDTNISPFSPKIFLFTPIPHILLFLPSPNDPTPKLHIFHYQYFLLSVNKQFLFIMFQIHERIAHFQSSSGCTSPWSYPIEVIVIVVCCLLGIIWAVVNVFEVQRINVRGGYNGDPNYRGKALNPRQESLLLELGDKISEGAQEFLRSQYLICFIFIGVMFIIIALLTEQGLWTAFAFLIGAVVSVICGIVGMVIATRTNFRVTYCAYGSLASAFKTAYRAGCVMGFALVSLGLLILTVLILLYKRFRGLDDGSSEKQYYRPLFESIAGYGLGGSFVALFGRVGGGIYTKAADVGADLVGKLEQNLPEDSPKNPATIADNVGDNVGDVAGMSADLFGSFAESTCAALVISSDTLVGTGSCNFFISNLMYPLLVIAFGIVICILVSLLATHILDVQTNDRIETTLKITLIVSTIVLIGISYLAAFLSYPGSFELRLSGKTIGDRSALHAFLCTLFGLVSGLIIAGFTEYITSHTYRPVRSLAESCKSGAASNVTLGLALGYFSTVLPAIFIALTAFLANYFLGYYGVALAALGMLTNLPLSLAIDGYGPISDNAGGIAEMAELDPFVRERTDALDAAGNTTAAIGKGFAIGSAALVSLALYGGFLHNAGLQFTDLISMTEPVIFAGLLIGAMLPYLFSAFTIRSVGVAAQGMVREVRRQLNNDPGILRGTSQPDFRECIKISTRAALCEMIAPGMLVILTPLLLGFIFGPKILAGFLPGAIVSGVMLAISAANTGGAWDNAKKYIESGQLKGENGVSLRKGSNQHKAAVVGDTVGDPLKDTSGPALNILMKLMAIISLIFGSKFAQLHPIK